MSEEDANETLYQALERQPGIVFDILDRISGPGGYHPQPGETTPQWCCCTHCREMPSMVERVCIMLRLHSRVLHIHISGNSFLVFYP